MDTPRREVDMERLLQMNRGENDTNLIGQCFHWQASCLVSASVPVHSSRVT